MNVMSIDLTCRTRYKYYGDTKLGGLTVSSGKEDVNRWVLRRRRKTDSDGELTTSTGRVFQMAAPATENDRAPR